MFFHFLIVVHLTNNIILQGSSLVSKRSHSLGFVIGGQYPMFSRFYVVNFMCI